MTNDLSEASWRYAVPAQRGIRRVAQPPVSAPAVETRPGAGVILDERILVSGYLSAVASRLDERGIMVRTLGVDGSGGEAWAGTLSLAVGGGSRWAPTRLRWEHDCGWSATLQDGQDCRGVQRYLSGQLIPAPVTVAHFVAALSEDPHTIWARATFRRPRQVDHRWLILQLSRFALPEPW